MNFQKVREVVGQKDDKNYQVKVPVQGTVGSTPGIEYSGKGTKFQRIMITDPVGESQKVKIYTGTGTGLNEGRIGQTLSFDIGPNPAPDGTMYYAGFWNSNVQTAPPIQGQNAPPQAPQGHQQPTERPNAPKGDVSRVDARNCVVSSYIQSGKEPTIKEVEYWVDYIINGEVPLPPAVEQPPKDDEPWEH